MYCVIKNNGTSIRDFVSRVKTNGLYTAGDGQVLRIISTKDIIDLTGAQPILTIKDTGGYLHISFRKDGADGINIYDTRILGHAYV